MKTPSPRIDDPTGRRRLGPVLVRLSLFSLLLILSIPARAQDEPIHMTPEFPLIFPLAQNGDDVTVKYPILINPTTVIKPGMILRTLYVLSIDEQQPGASDLVLAHKGDMDQAYSRPPPGSSTGPKLPPELAHELEGYRRTVWQVSNNFVLAMAQMPTDSTHLIYSPKGNDQDIKDERFSFFDGLMVGLPDGKVTVIAVEKESKAEGAGIKAGDEILSVGGVSTGNDLATFAADYANAKKVATDYEVDSYSMTIRSTGGETRQVNIPMPPKLKGGLMDDFNEAPAPSKPSAPSVTP